MSGEHPGVSGEHLGDARECPGMSGEHPGVSGERPGDVLECRILPPGYSKPGRGPGGRGERFGRDFDVILAAPGSHSTIAMAPEGRFWSALGKFIP